MSAKEKLKEATSLKDPWWNVYWFSRMLINGDKYGGIHRENKLLSELGMNLRKILQERDLDDGTKLILSKKVLLNLRDQTAAKTGSTSIRRVALFDDLLKNLDSMTGVVVLIVAIENIVLPINSALEAVPSNDRDFTEKLAKTYLDERGDDALSTVLRLWDDAGVKGCLDAERIVMVREFGRLKENMPKLPERETNMILTTFVQEFERRLSQKRKARAGGSLEDVASFLFSYFKIKATNSPEHFESGIEIDKWIRCGDKWLIGISCKRTIRERWKQVSSATKDVLSKHKIKEVWHLTTFDEDISDDKLAYLGMNRHIFYLMDDSRKYQYYKDHIGLKEYVRPMSRFIDDLRDAIEKKGEAVFS
jgi:hypothetical protein